MKTLTETTEKIRAYQNLINLLQKNNNLNYLGEYKKCLTVLSNNQEELEKLDIAFKKDYSDIFKEKENNRALLISNLQKVAGLLKLSPQINKDKNARKNLDFLSENLDEFSDKHILKLAQKTLSLANKFGGYSFSALDSISPKKLNKKITRATEISHDFGLSSDMVKQLEDSALALIKGMIPVESVIQERLKILKQINKLFEKNEKLIEKKIDKFVEIYEKPGSTFLSGYNNLRPEKKELEKV